MTETTLKKERYVYLGPELKKGLYKTGKILKGFPNDLDDYLEEKPSLKMLFVKSENIVKAKMDMQKDGSALATIYKEIALWAKGGDK